MKNIITTFKQIKEIIAPIPADKFCTGDYVDGEGRCCFLGHIQKHVLNNPHADGDGFGARELTRLFLKETFKTRYPIDGSDVNNDRNINGYTESIIKDRLMHMIEDGIKWETK